MFVTTGAPDGPKNTFIHLKTKDLKSYAPLQQSLFSESWHQVSIFYQLTVDVMLSGMVNCWQRIK